MNLDTPLSQVPGIGFGYSKRLAQLNLFTVGDLITHYPFRFDDFSVVSSSIDARVGEKVTLQGEIWSIKNVYTRSRKVLTQAIFNDGTFPVELTWFNSPWLTKQIQVGDKLKISGKLAQYKNKISITMPQWEKLIGEVQNSYPVSTSESAADVRLVPVYPETAGISSKWLHSKITAILPQVLDKITDPLPDQIKGEMLSLQDSLQKIHFPKDYQEIDKAKQRLAFDELFFIQLATLRTRHQWKQKTLVEPLKVGPAEMANFTQSLPFELTKSQRKVLDEIISDLSRQVPMNRLVQGEVGSGKTVVAAAIIYLLHLNNLRSLYMAPTEILAFQHFETLTKLLGPFGISVGIYTGSRKKISASEVIVGTHALLSSKLNTPDVGLIIVDEQQRFGVEQRSLLRSKAIVPHFLTMTATPIPRTVALTLYGDLDISVINELPKGRPKISTHLVPERKREDSYQFLRKHARAGEQIYIITPLIEESDTLQSVKAATIEFQRLTSEVFPDLKLGLLHGRLKAKDKEQVLNSFKNHNIDILVSTSVVEVGVDIPNATIMVIEGAERFGLAQLHQLRGRIGRGTKESFCLLYTSHDSSQERSRLKNLETTFDGLKLAELDLRIRGGGEIFGLRQSGRWNLKMADLSDLALVEKTRTAANKLLEDNLTLDKYPLLQAQLASISGNVMPD